MSRADLNQILFRILMFSGICGYEVVAGVTSLLGVESTPGSVALRALVLLLAAMVLIAHAGKALRGPRVLIIGYAAFWYLYVCRIAYSTIESNEVLDYPSWYYFLWALGACALPMFAVSLWSPRYADSDKNFLALFLALLIGGALAAFGASSLDVSASGQEVIETGRLQLTALNPILLGQLGATILVLSVWTLAAQFDVRRPIFKLICLVAAVSGGALLIGANSRGPIVSAVACLIFIVCASSKRSRIIAIFSFLVAASAFVPAAKYLESEYGFSTYSRLFGQSQLTEENTQNRLSRFEGALNAFADKPILGASLEEPIHGGYPHNIFIETLMSLGVLGTLLLLVLLGATFFYAIRLYVNVPRYGWVTLLLIQYTAAAQFSGSIYTMNYLWISAGLVISFYSTTHSSRGVG